MRQFLKADRTGQLFLDMDALEQDEEAVEELLTEAEATCEVLRRKERMSKGERVSTTVRDVLLLFGAEAEVVHKPSKGVYTLKYDMSGTRLRPRDLYRFFQLMGACDVDVDPTAA